VETICLQKEKLDTSYHPRKQVVWIQKNLTINYRREGGRPGDEDGGRWTETGSRSFSISYQPEVGYKIAARLSTYNDSWPLSDDEDKIEFAMPADWHLEKELFESLPSGENEDRKLEEPWLEFFKTLTNFESFSSQVKFRWVDGSESVRKVYFSVSNGHLDYSDEYYSEEPKSRGWRYQLDQWIYEGDDGNLYDNLPTEEEIVSNIQTLSLQKSNDLYQDLLKGLRMHLKSGLQGATQRWDFQQGDFWTHIRLLAELERDIK
jgi:hypothetical protein